MHTASDMRPRYSGGALHHTDEHITARTPLRQRSILFILSD